MENSKINRTSRNITPDQKEVMITFIKKIQNNKSASSISVKQWQELTDILNSIPGPMREWKEWRQVVDLHYIYIYIANTIYYVNCMLGT